MKNPPHPGQIVRFDCLKPLGLAVTEGAKVLGVSGRVLNHLVNGKAGVSPEMAIRLAKAFGSTPEMWLRLQRVYDLAQARQYEGRSVTRFAPHTRTFFSLLPRFRPSGTYVGRALRGFESAKSLARIPRIR